MIKCPIIGVVIVSYGHEKVLLQQVNQLRSQMRNNDKIVVVDNHLNKKGYNNVVNNKSVDYAIKSANNGFSAGCNIGAAKLAQSVDILLFLNPDTLPSKNMIDVIRSADYLYYAAVMPLLILPDKTVNCAGNIVHTSGLSWCGGYGKQMTNYTTDQEVSVLSGACMAVNINWWKKIGGMPESYFMYYEDTDFCTRITLQGGKMGLLADAFVKHDYEYEKGDHKWLYLERNRPLYIIRTWPNSVIAVLFIQLFFVEIGLWIIAIIQKRLKLKLKSASLMIKSLPAALQDRRNIQKNRTISGYDFMKTLTFKLDSPLLGGVDNNYFINFIFSIYYKVCLFILKPFN